MLLAIGKDIILFVLDPSAAFDEVTILFQPCISYSEFSLGVSVLST